MTDYLKKKRIFKYCIRCTKKTLKIIYKILTKLNGRKWLEIRNITIIDFV